MPVLIKFSGSFFVHGRFDFRHQCNVVIINFAQLPDLRSTTRPVSLNYSINFTQPIDQFRSTIRRISLNYSINFAQVFHRFHSTIRSVSLNYSINLAQAFHQFRSGIRGVAAPRPETLNPKLFEALLRRGLKP